MLAFKNVLRPTLGAALMVWGLGGQAWATYGGGACYRSRLPRSINLSPMSRWSPKSKRYTRPFIRRSTNNSLTP